MKKKTSWLIFSWYALPLAWMGVIFWLSSQPVLPGPEVFWQDFIFKKTAHMGVFVILAQLWWLALSKTEQVTGKIDKKFIWICLLCGLFALSDEWHQSFVPGRTATWRDVGFDGVGFSLALLWSYRLI